MLHAIGPAYVINIADIMRLSCVFGVVLIVAAILVEVLFPERRAQRSATLGRPVRVFLILQFLLTVSCYLLLWHRESWAEYPGATPFLPFHHWLDLMCFLPRFQHLRSISFFQPGIGEIYQYPGSDALLYELFYSSHHPIWVFLGSTGVAVCTLAFGLARQIAREGVGRAKAYAYIISVVLLSYPLWFEYALANLELCIFLLVTAGMWCFLNNRTYSAALLWGVAGGMKVYPAAYLGLMLAKKQYKQMAVALATATVCNLAGLWMIGPSIRVASLGVKSGLLHFREHYIRTLLRDETSIDHSVFGLVKRIFLRHAGAQLPDWTVTTYLAIAAVVGLTFYFTRIRKMPVINQIAALCIASVLLPPTSHDYTLLHLYVPWAVFTLYSIKMTRNKVKLPRGLVPVFVCFAFLFSSESEIATSHAGFSGQFKCITLIALFILILCYPFKPELEGKNAVQAKDHNAVPLSSSLHADA